MTIGERIKKLRLEKMKMTQVAFADAINVSKQTLYKYENDLITNIPFDKIEAIAALCHTSPSEIMGWHEDPNILKRDALLEEIDLLLSNSNFSLQCESYDDPLFIINNKINGTRFAVTDSNLLETYSSLKAQNRLSAQELVASLHMEAASSADPFNTKQGVRIPVLGRVAAGIPINAIEEILDWEEIPEEMARQGEFFGLQIKGDSMSPRIMNGDVVIVRKQDDADTGDIVIAIINGDDGCCKKLKKTGNEIVLISLNPAYSPMVFTEAESDTIPVRIIGKVVELRGKF